NVRFADTRRHVGERRRTLGYLTGHARAASRGGNSSDVEKPYSPDTCTSIRAQVVRGNSDPLHNSTPCAVRPPGEWPSLPEELPLVMTDQQYAHLRGVTVRTLQRERRLNISIPYIRDGRKIRYARHHVLARFGLSCG